jgi:Fe-S-cluster containining protein
LSIGLSNAHDRGDESTLDAISAIEGRSSDQEGHDLHRAEHIGLRWSVTTAVHEFMRLGISNGELGNVPITLFACSNRSYPQGIVMSNPSRQARRQQQRASQEADIQPRDKSGGMPLLSDDVEVAKIQIRDHITGIQFQGSTDIMDKGGKAYDLAANAYWFADGAVKKSGGYNKWECKSGCSWCCHQQVSVTAVEAIAIADKMRADYPPDWIEAIKVKVDSAARVISPMVKSEDYLKARVPCALLAEGGQCSIYANRPLMCRSYSSFSVNSCKQCFDEPERDYVEMDNFALSVGLGIIDGMLSACIEKHRDGLMYEFHSALLRALEVPDASERWQRGERVFDGCKLSMFHS